MGKDYVQLVVIHIMKLYREWGGKHPSDFGDLTIRILIDTWKISDGVHTITTRKDIDRFRLLTLSGE